MVFFLYPQTCTNIIHLHKILIKKYGTEEPKQQKRNSVQYSTVEEVGMGHGTYNSGMQEEKNQIKKIGTEILC